MKIQEAIKIIISHPEKNFFQSVQAKLPASNAELFYLTTLEDLRPYAQKVDPHVNVVFVGREFQSNKELNELIPLDLFKEKWLIFLLSASAQEFVVNYLRQFPRSIFLPAEIPPSVVSHNLKAIVESEIQFAAAKTRREIAEYLVNCLKILYREKTLDENLGELVNYLPKIFPYDYWAVFTVDPELHQVLHFAQFVPPHLRKNAIITPKLEKLALGFATRGEEFELSYHQDEHLFRKLREWGWHVEQIYFLPFRLKGEVGGGILIGNTKETKETKEGMNFLSSLAEILSQRVLRFFKIAKIGQFSDGFADQLIANRFSEEAILQIACKMINQVTDADSTIFWQINRGFGFLFPKYSYFKKSESTPREIEKNIIFLNKDPQFNKIISSDATHLLENVAENPDLNLATRQTFAKLEYGNLFIAPIRIQHEEIGVIIANKKKKNDRFMPWQIDWVEQLLKKLHTVLHDTFVVREANYKLKQLSRIFELGNEIKLDLNLEEILARILQSIRKTLGWNDAVILRSNDFLKSYEPVRKVGFDKKGNFVIDFFKPVPFQEFNKFIRKCKKISSSYFYESHPVSVNNHVLPAEHELISEWHDQDLLAIPIETRRKYLGYLIVHDPVDRLKPTEDKVKALEYFANQAAVAIENSYLYENLQTSEERYRALAETMTLALVTCDFKQKILYVNPAFERLVGKEKRVLTKQPLSSYFTDKSKEKLAEIVETIEKIDETRKSIENVELELIPEQGEVIPVSTFAFPFYQQRQKVGFFLVLNDLRLAKKLERLKADFNSMIVHDLRSPMNVIQGFLELIRNRVVGDINSEQEELLDLAKENVKKVLMLVDNFLVASKIEVGKFSIEPKVNELNSLLERIIENHKLLVKNKNITIESRLNKNLPLLLFDPLRIEQVMNNLLSNAAKFTPEGGKITVTTDLYQKEIKGEVKFFARVGVHDTGVGIPPDKIDQIFQKYEQAESALTLKSAGTGLGLSICKEVINLHGGEIWVESEVNKGSHFYFTLPIEPSIEKFIK